MHLKGIVDFPTDIGEKKTLLLAAAADTGCAAALLLLAGGLLFFLHRCQLEFQLCLLIAFKCISKID